MAPEHIFQSLIRETQKAYSAHPALTDFLAYPKDVIRQDVAPFHANCCDVFCKDAELHSANYGSLQRAIRAASEWAHWRETYKGTKIDAAFMEKFACYCIIGDNAPFSSDTLRLFMVYMPAGLFYPWHHHPAEEMYLVVSGNAVFMREDCQDERLTEGQTSYHASNQSHAMKTTDDSVLCLVAWRNHFGTRPVWSG